MRQTDAVQISARGDYAVRAAVALAAAYPRTLSAQVLAAEHGMPRKFLETILADLRRAGLVQSTRGVDVLRAADGPLAGVRGVRPEETSYDGTTVHLRELWIAVRASVRRVLDEVSLAELAKGRLPAHVRRLIADNAAWKPR